jgi:hypothetical protein
MVVALLNHERPRISMQKNTTNSSPDGHSEDSKSSGCRNGPIAPRRRGTWPIYAAAGQCDYGCDGNAWIAFDRAGDFVLDEEHLYVASEPLPRAQCP